ncbi:MAG TPA: hypothetical protein VKY73_06835 [Polyangiaceae bacterium]|nr:hypothetical protein [Polyangiaceae bacterium]
MKIKSTTAFRAYAAARARRSVEQTAATARFIVKSVNKDGSISRMALTPSNWRLNAFVDEAAADARRAELEAMNPGRRYAVVAL